ncbi:MAG: nucleoside diphosphate kinase regulator [Kiritimatiellae bacterium]|nr:nucleoside diphosphate kinase regulator [Kiritimatiellia bacterium]
MKHIYITQNDYDRLLVMLSEREKAENKDSPYLQSLRQEIARAIIVPSDKIPRHVITMHSQVSLRDMDSREDMVYTLTFPDEADAAGNKISILAPIGTALIGYSVGDTIEWKVPTGLRRLKVMKIIYQPEAAGRLD